VRLYPSSASAEGLPLLFDLSAVEHAALLEAGDLPWAAVGRIGAFLEALLDGPYPPGVHSPLPEGVVVGERVYLGPGCTVEPGVYIKGPAWIGSGCILRQGLYCKENVIAEAGAFLGHASELKNCYLMPGAEVPHFNYVGDSILGSRAHLGAGVVLSNFRLDKRSVPIRLGGRVLDSGLAKLGAIIGDDCQIGCNSVLNPGSLIGRASVLYPLSRWSGTMQEGGIHK
jgi:UDP-N-acetylglucosamine diphosphorylase / glucose-1-phosphate thymidylyltransferase / UDP-N-acetylgalactosamine diphosphorylase / glucosamine-1-phosphate N-acetyltransferase / galactosamine-1-phosphate N-acetyltransferase